MPAKTPIKKKKTSRASSKFIKPSASKKMLFINIGVASLAVIAFMGYTVFQSINNNTADAAGTSTLGR